MRWALNADLILHSIILMSCCCISADVRGTEPGHQNGDRSPSTGTSATEESAANSQSLLFHFSSGKLQSKGDKEKSHNLIVAALQAH